MSARVLLPLLTTDDLIGLPDDGSRYELIDGELYVTRAPHINHQDVILNIASAIKVYLSNHPVGHVAVEPGVIFDKHNAVIPDVAFISAARYAEILVKGKLLAAPDLAIEVLSAGSEQEARDRVLKLRLYGKEQVREYWIVDPRARTVEIYLLADEGLRHAQTLDESAVLATALLPGFDMPVNKVFEF